MANGYKYYADLPSWAKGVIAVSTLAAIGFVGYKIYQAVKGKSDSRDEQKESNSALKEYKRLSKNDTLSHSETTYRTVANTIQNLLDGCESQQSEIDVVDMLKDLIKKPIDWYYLVYIFDVRSIDNCGIGTGDTIYALPTLLKEQLGSPTKGALIKTNAEVLKEHLNKIGIAF